MNLAKPGSRVLASHALAATAVAMPWPLLLAEVWSTTGSDVWLGVAVAPLAVAGAAGTVIGCVSTDVLQRAVPDHVRAFALGLTDALIVLAAMVGALIAPGLVSMVGAPTLFVVAGVLLVAAIPPLVRSDRRATAVAAPSSPAG